MYRLFSQPGHNGRQITTVHTFGKFGDQARSNPCLLLQIDIFLVGGDFEDVPDGRVDMTHIIIVEVHSVPEIVESNVLRKVLL